MKKNSDFKYILIPLPLIQHVFKNEKSGIIDIFYYGIYLSSTKQKVQLESALTQVMYCYYRRFDELPKNLSRQIEALIKQGIIECDDYYNGFSGNTFDPFDESSGLPNPLLYAEEHPSFANDVLEFHRLRQVKEILKLEFDIETSIAVYRKYYREHKGFPKAPYISLKTDMMIKFSKEQNAFQKAVFAMYSGIRSILGNKKFACTTRDMIVCRMFGAKNKEDLESILKDEGIKAAYDIYSKRYQFEKLLDYLLWHKFISSKIGYKRRTYLSCALSYNELAECIRKRLENVLNVGGGSHKQNELQAKSYLNQHLKK